MTKKDKRLLLKQAARLTTLGITVEQERKSLAKLVEHGVLYDAPEMRETLKRFQKANTAWKQLESEHRTLRKRLNKI